MVDLRSDGPAECASLLWRQRSGELFCTVVAKLTYRLAPGECEIAPAAEPVLDRDQTSGGSVRASSDLAPFKPAADVTLVGSGFAPGGQPVRSVVCRLVVGSVDKMLEAWVERSFTSDGSVAVGAARTTFELSPERAAGGPGTDNPVGIETGAGGRIPFLQPAGHSEIRPGDYVPTATFAPIGQDWPSRARLLRDADRAWLMRPDGGKMAADLEATFFHAAPLDQRRQWPIAANERIVLENLHPEHGRLVTNLPGLEPKAVVLAPREEVLTMTADALHIDTDRRIVTVTWRAQVRSPEPPDELKIVVTTMRMGQSLSFSDLKKIREAARSRAPKRELDPLDRTAAEPTSPPGKPLPFPSSHVGASPRSNAAPSLVALPFKQEVGAPAVADDPTPQLPPPPSPPMPGPVPASVAAAAAMEASGGVSTPLARLGSFANVTSAKPATFGSAFAESKAPLEMKKAAEESRADDKKAFRWGWDSGPPKAPSGSAAPAPASRTAEPAKSPASVAPPPMEPPKPARDGSNAAGFSAREASDGAASRARSRSSDAPPARETRGAAQRQRLVSIVYVTEGIAARLEREKEFAEAFGFSPLRRSEERTMDERTKALRVLSCCAAIDGAALRAHVEGVLRDPERMDLPLVLIEGELRPVFDEIETLKLTVAAAQPFAVGEKRLADAVRMAEDMLKGPLPAPRESAMSLARQIEQAAAPPVAPQKYVPQQVQRALLEQRHFKQRNLFGSPHLRMDFVPARSDKPLVAYLDASASAQLPLLNAIPIVALAELRPREDALEQQQDALLLVAAARKLDLAPAP